MTPFPFGADYYPEHWPEERWKKDADLMRRAGFNIVRLAEFAWSKIEPREGVYDFEWLDKAINTLSRKGIRAVLGTPTAAPPPWIIKAYPDILRIDGHGRREAAGTRKNYCANNPDYIERSKRIVERMALHYKDNLNIVGWQIDNEFGGDICYCETCIRAFREWLKAKYASHDNLNKTCGLIFWGQEYNSWEEIFPPRPPVVMQNPALNLEWHRFMNDSWIKYQQIQIDIIRTHATHQLITHNFMGMYKELDYFRLAEPLDFVCFDYYPKWGGKVDYVIQAMSHDIMRSLKKKPYWIMELQSGAVKTLMAPIPKPGEIRFWTIHSVARGADCIVYFRWRSCRFGAEEYWHGILDHDGIPRRRYSEVKEVSGDLRKIAPHIEGTRVKPTVAITLVYDNIWALDLEDVGKGNNYYGMNSWKPTLDWYRALYARSVLTDFVNPEIEEIRNYRAIFVPSLMLMTNEIEKQLRSFVKGGGTLIAMPRTGAKDWNNNIANEPLPGSLSDVFGISLEEYTGLPEGEAVEMQTVKMELGINATYTCTNWAEALSPNEAKTVTLYQTGFLRGKPAATINRFGDGIAIYIGTFAAKEFYLNMVDWLIKKRIIEQVLPSVDGFEATKRISSEHEIVFALNQNDNPVQIHCHGREYQDLLTSRKVKGTLKIDGLDVRILKLLN